MILRRYPMLRGLLLLSLLSTSARALTLPFIPIILATRFPIGPVAVGAAMGASLGVGACATLLGGVWMDRANQADVVLVSSTLLAGSLGVLPWSSHLGLTIVFLAVADGAGAVTELAVKAMLVRAVRPEDRMRAFSANYTVMNIGYAVGPAAGALVVGRGERTLFLLAAGVGSLALVPTIGALSRRHRWAPLVAARTTRWTQTMKVVLDDRKLLWFGLAGFSCAMVYARFSAFLAQYMAVVTDPDTAYRMVAFVIAVNSILVIALQYPIGKGIRSRNLLRLQAKAVLFFIVGLTGFAIDHGYVAWGLAIAVFSVGEMIAVPTSYAFIDDIAPDHLKGLYYGVEHLSGMGGALTPLLCGLLLSNAPTWMMFVVLGALGLVSLLLYVAGDRAASGRKRPV
jgi:MFS family permease